MHLFLFGCCSFVLPKNARIRRGRLTVCRWDGAERVSGTGSSARKVPGVLFGARPISCRGSPHFSFERVTKGRLTCGYPHQGLTMEKLRIGVVGAGYWGPN